MAHGRERGHRLAYFERLVRDGYDHIPIRRPYVPPRAHRLGLEARRADLCPWIQSSEWVIADIAAMCVGAAPAGLHRCSPEEVQYIAHRTEPPSSLVRTSQWAKLDAMRAELPHLRKVVLMAQTL